MSISAPTIVHSGFSGFQVANYSSVAFTPAPAEHYLIWVVLESTSTNIDVSSLTFSGTGLGTITRRGETDGLFTGRRTFVFEASSTGSGTSGAITVTGSALCNFHQLHIERRHGTDGVNPSNVVDRTEGSTAGTVGSLTMAALLSSENVVAAQFHIYAAPSEDLVPAANWTESGTEKFAGGNSVMVVGRVWALNRTDPGMSWTTSTVWEGLGVELIATVEADPAGYLLLENGTDRLLLEDGSGLLLLEGDAPAIEFEADLIGSGVLTANLETAIRFASALQGSGLLAAPAVLTTAIRFAAALQASGILTGDLAGGAQLAAAMSTSGTLAAALTTAIRMAAAMQGSGAISAELLTAIRFAASMQGSGALTADLLAPGATQLAAALQASGLLTADLRIPEIAFLAAALQGGSTLTADLLVVAKIIRALADAGVIVLPGILARTAAAPAIAGVTRAAPGIIATTTLSEA